LLDKTNPNTLIVAQNRPSSSYAYLRSIDITTGDAGVLVSSGLNHPKGMTWDENEDILYVTNNHYIAKITWSTKAVETVLGSTSSGNIVGGFSQSLLSTPKNLLFLTPEIIIVTGWGTTKLITINMASQISMNVDIFGFDSHIYSVAQFNGSIYVGTDGKIYKLSGEFTNPITGREPFIL